MIICGFDLRSFRININVYITFMLRVNAVICKAQITLRQLCDFTKASPQGKSWTQIMKVHDTNHVAVSPTFVICVCDKVHRLCRRLSSCTVTDQIILERHKRVCRELVTNFIANILTCRDCFVSPKLHDFMICHRLCQRLS